MIKAKKSLKLLECSKEIIRRKWTTLALHWGWRCEVVTRTSTLHIKWNQKFDPEVSTGQVLEYRDKGLPHDLMLTKQTHAQLAAESLLQTASKLSSSSPFLAQRWTSLLERPASPSFCVRGNFHAHHNITVCKSQFSSLIHCWMSLWGCPALPRVWLSECNLCYLTPEHLCCNTNLNIPIKFQVRGPFHSHGVSHNWR